METIIAINNLQSLLYTLIGRLNTEGARLSKVTSNTKISEAKFKQAPFSYDDGDKFGMLLYLSENYIRTLALQDNALKAVIKNKVTDFELNEYKAILSSWYKYLITTRKSDYLYVQVQSNPQSDLLKNLFETYLNFQSSCLDLMRDNKELLKYLEALDEMKLMSTYLSAYSVFHSAKIGLNIANLSDSQKIYIGHILSHPNNQIHFLKNTEDQSSETIILNNVSYKSIEQFFANNYITPLKINLEQSEKSISFLTDLSTKSLHVNPLIQSSQKASFAILMQKIQRIKEESITRLFAIQESLETLKELDQKCDISIIADIENFTILTSPKASYQDLSPSEMLRAMAKACINDPKRSPLIFSKPVEVQYDTNQKTTEKTKQTENQTIMEKPELSMSSGNNIASTEDIIEDLKQSLKRVHNTCSKPDHIPYNTPVNTLAYNKEKLSFSENELLETFQISNNTIEVFMKPALKDLIFKDNPASINRIQNAIAKGFVPNKASTGMKQLVDEKEKALEVDKFSLLEIKLLGRGLTRGVPNGDYRIICAFDTAHRKIYALEEALGHKTMSIAIKNVMSGIMDGISKTEEIIMKK